MNDTAPNDFMSEITSEAEEAKKAPPADTLEQVQLLGTKVNILDERIAKGEALLADLKAEKNNILSKDLPDLMDSKGLEDFSVDGRTFKVENYFKASIPSENPDPGHDWLEEHGHGDIIRNTIIVSLPKDYEEQAKEIEDHIRQRYQEATVERKRQVPWAALTSWLKELWNSDDENKVLPPLDIIGGTVGRIVKVKEKKSK